MAYYFYNTSERIRKKIEELEKELESVQNKFDKIVSGKTADDNLVEVENEINGLIVRIRYFSAALKNRLER
ncbi:MAG: hypothetical protein JWR18_461 [Segetibacter sp.]|jgi:hypothetical protein|nr:hypothetical protein [Segetibacter sp.]